MAQIRFVDVWLRAPGAHPTYFRSVMVVAEKWAEQRVLMRAFAESRDQTRPTITMHASELAIGPAGIEVNGAWGIHVGDHPEGRPQQVKTQLEEAARRLAGSKGNPPRLLDEEATFEREPTANWGPGAPRMLPRRPEAHETPVTYVAPAAAARVPNGPAATFLASGAPTALAHPAPAHATIPDVSAPSNPELRTTPLPRRRGPTRQPAVADGTGRQGRTALGYQSGSGAQSAIVRLGLAPQVSARLGWLVDVIVPQDFQIDSRERRVLTALGETELTARAIGHMLDVVDPVTYMEELTRKLESYGLDLVEPGHPHGGEPTYRLRTS